MVMMLVLSLGTGVVAAQSFQGASGTVVVEEGETYDGISGISGSIIISGTVTGDVSGVSGQIHVTETGVVEAPSRPPQGPYSSTGAWTETSAPARATSK